MGNYEESDLREKVLETLKASLVLSNEATATYDANFSLQMKNENAVTYSYLHRKLANVAAFRKSKGGATQALKNALRTMTERGDLGEISRAKMSQDYGSSSVAYGITRPAAFDL